jgi:hypothetical protein
MTYQTGKALRWYEIQIKGWFDLCREIVEEEYVVDLSNQEGYDRSEQEEWKEAA